MDLADVKPYATLLSVIGPAIIFFSWIMSNTLQQRYQTAKSSVERAQSERRLYGELTEARQSVEGLARELNKVRTEFNDLRRARAAEANKPRELQECDRESVELAVVSTAIGAQQIDWGARFCSNEVELSRVLAAKSGVAHTLKATSIELTQLRKAKDELLSQMSRLLGSSRTIDGRPKSNPSPEADLLRGGAPALRTVAPTRCGSLEHSSAGSRHPARTRQAASRSDVLDRVCSLYCRHGFGSSR